MWDAGHELRFQDCPGHSGTVGTYATAWQMPQPAVSWADCERTGHDVATCSQLLYAFKKSSVTFLVLTDKDDKDDTVCSEQLLKLQLNIIVNDFQSQLSNSICHHWVLLLQKVISKYLTAIASDSIWIPLLILCIYVCIGLVQSSYYLHSSETCNQIYMLLFLVWIVGVHQCRCGWQR